MEMYRGGGRLHMTPEAYRELRKGIGNQKFVAEKLGLHKQTLSNRERGVKPIDREAELALMYLQTLMEVSA